MKLSIAVRCSNPLKELYMTLNKALHKLNKALTKLKKAAHKA